MVMLDPIRSTYKYRDKSGREIMQAEIACDTADELDGLISLGNVVFAPGSRAHVIKEAKLYTLASDLLWYEQAGGGDTSREVSLAVSPLTGRMVTVTKEEEQ